MINRGISKRPLFETRDDARFFLARLVRQIRLGRVEVHAYCLMTTHFHLLVRSPIGELSEGMRRVQNEHSRRFNRMHRRDGALIRGVYFSRPVGTLAYRRALVRYIDANPVKAGVVSASESHELGSAAAYLGGSSPAWLSREWVESDACRAAGSEAFTPAAYRAAFGCSDPVELEELTDFLDARIASPGKNDPLEDLVGAAPHQVQAWMQDKARLADGHRLGLPVCGRVALWRALEESATEQDAWVVEEGRRTWRGRDVAWPGLLRDLCCLPWREIAEPCGGSIARARRAWTTHRRLLGADAAYARRVARVGHAAIARCSGREGSAGVSAREPKPGHVPY